MVKRAAHIVICGTVLAVLAAPAPAAGLSAWCDETRTIIVLAPPEAGGATPWLNGDWAKQMTSGGGLAALGFKGYVTSNTLARPDTLQYLRGLAPTMARDEIAAAVEGAVRSRGFKAGAIGLAVVGTYLVIDAMFGEHAPTPDAQRQKLADDASRLGFGTVRLVPCPERAPMRGLPSATALSPPPTPAPITGMPSTALGAAGAASPLTQWSRPWAPPPKSFSEMLSATPVGPAAGTPAQPTPSPTAAGRPPTWRVPSTTVQPVAPAAPFAPAAPSSQNATVAASAASSPSAQPTASITYVPPFNPRPAAPARRDLYDFSGDPSPLIGTPGGFRPYEHPEQSGGGR